MNDFDLQRDASPLVSQVSRALRLTRSRRGLSQRELAQQIGISKSRLGRLESDAGPQSLEMVCQVLMASGFRLEVIDVSPGALHGAGAAASAQPRSAQPTSTERTFTQRTSAQPASAQPTSAQSASTRLALCDASGRRFPAHLDAYRMGYPPPYWFVRNGGWNTSTPFPEWTYERRFVPRTLRRPQELNRQSNS